MNSAQGSLKVRPTSTETFAAHAPSPSAWRRALNRVCSLTRGRHAWFVYSPLYRVDLGKTPIDVERAERILTFLLAYGLLRTSRLLRPQRASLSDLRLAHSARYLDALRRPSSLDGIVGSEVWPELHEQALLAQRAAVGGTVLATHRALLRPHTTVANLGGGFHHAGRHEGRGFCIFNDVAVAIHKARGQGFSAPVLIVDLDLHDGNGTRQIFAEDTSVFTFSIHNQSWDRDPATASLSIELTGEIDDETYLTTLRSHLPVLLDEVRPGLVYYLAGTDPAHDDRVGNWRISARGMLQRDRFVLSSVRGQSGRTPLVLLLAGGYGRDTWRYSARCFAWLLTGRDGPEPPSTADMTLARYRHLTEELQRHRQLGATEADWKLTEADVIGGFGQEASRSLFLGHYSHHAVELTLEWTGILDRLRQMGFADPVLELDLDNPSGHTARVHADPQHRHLLIELRLRLDRRSISDMELLSLEWLLLQNPRVDFSPSETRLPGQSHPGLGLVPDIMTLLVLMCDQLELDGITFVPSHFHLAVKGRKFLRFLSAEHEGWFRAARVAAGELPLSVSTTWIAEGRLIDRTRGEPVEWQPMRMVLPISERLHELVEGPTYERRAEETVQQLDFALTGPETATAPTTPAVTG